MAKCGKGCMPECEYFVTSGCISPFNCPYKIEEPYFNSASSTPTQYTGVLAGTQELKIKEWYKNTVGAEPPNYDAVALKAYIAYLEKENAELKLKDIRCASSVAEMIASCDKCGLFECYGCKHSYTAAQEVKKLQAENAALRARLGKFDDLHIQMGEKVYIIADDNEIIERFICGVHILSTEIIFVTTTQKNYKSCNKKGIAAHIAHAFENSFGLLPLRDFGERSFIHRESALVRLAELKGGKER